MSGVDCVATLSGFAAELPSGVVDILSDFGVRGELDFHFGGRRFWPQLFFNRWGLGDGHFGDGDSFGVEVIFDLSEELVARLRSFGGIDNRQRRGIP